MHYDNKRVVARTAVSKEQLDTIQQFEADYNAIDHFLRTAVRAEKQISFTHVVTEYSRGHGGWRDGDLLRTIAELRNAIVHTRTEPYRYLAVPLESVALDLKRCRERLTNPARAIPIFYLNRAFRRIGPGQGIDLGKEKCQIRAV